MRHAVLPHMAVSVAACAGSLTHRIKRDPSRHLLYDNLDGFVRATEKWLLNPARRRQHTLRVVETLNVQNFLSKQHSTSESSLDAAHSHYATQAF